jgi:signal transduction histidine kinase
MEHAVKYGARARVDFSESEHGVEIHIEDDGPGIPDRLHEEAFRPFRRLGTNTNVKGSGLGLGVALGHRASARRGVLLANCEGGGLRATIALPQRLSKVTERAQPRQIARQWHQL